MQYHDINIAIYWHINIFLHPLPWYKYFTTSLGKIVRADLNWYISWDKSDLWAKLINFKYHTAPLK